MREKLVAILSLLAMFARYLQQVHPSTIFIFKFPARIFQPPITRLRSDLTSITE